MVKISSFKILTGKRTGKRLLGMPRRRLGNFIIIIIIIIIINIIIKYTAFGRSMD